MVKNLNNSPADRRFSFSHLESGRLKNAFAYQNSLIQRLSIAITFLNEPGSCIGLRMPCLLP
jgi:hypothetical protein